MDNKIEVPEEVQRSKFGCVNCLWAGVECKFGSKYKAETAKDMYGNYVPSCSSYTYYD